MTPVETKDPIFRALEERRIALGMNRFQVNIEAEINDGRYQTYLDGRTSPNLKTFLRLLDALQLRLVLVPRGSHGGKK